MKNTFILFACILFSGCVQNGAELKRALDNCERITGQSCTMAPLPNSIIDDVQGLVMAEVEKHKIELIESNVN